MVVDLQQRAKHPALSAGRAAPAEAAPDGEPLRRGRCSRVFDRHRCHPRRLRGSLSFAPGLRSRPDAASARSRARLPVAAPADSRSKRSAPATGMASTSLHRDAIAEPVGLAGRAADHGVAVLVILEIVIADGARRNESVRAGFVKLHEQPGAGDTRRSGPRRWRRSGRPDDARSAGRSVSRSAAMARRSAAEMRAEISFSALDVGRSRAGRRRRA